MKEKPSREELRERARKYLVPGAPDDAIEQLVEEEAHLLDLIENTDTTENAYPEFCFVSKRLISFAFDRYERGYRSEKKAGFQAGRLFSAFQGWQTDREIDATEISRLCRQIAEDSSQEASSIFVEARSWGVLEYTFLERENLPPPQASAFECICDWLEAVIHQRVHSEYYEHPEFFDPSHEKAWLRRLGAAQATLGHMDAGTVNDWLETIRIAAVRYKESPLWKEVGKGMVERNPRSQSHPELDGLIIASWPLVRHHNWTYADLLNVVRRLLPDKKGYPYEGYEDLAAHCRLTLGLTKSGKGKTSRELPPCWMVSMGLVCLPRSELNRNISVFPHP